MDPELAPPLNVTIKQLSIARLWDKDFKLLASALVDPDITPDRIRITVEGDGPMHGAVRTIVNEGSILDVHHLTIDPEPTKLCDFANRIGAIVNQISVDTRLCECGRPIITTSIRASRIPA
ncbi:hypothetical protein [Mycolicibacterium fluoranthenivorans]|uniref:Uncharacterized protein n=1 Tax=Mycolicibacterium fluoranthenivorans TaxID=258505 RepID=A0A7X5ZFA3_9MYCO|nr:hypothetical protein [Mycolicibacterium fluoranthenivorans]MCV7358493.1 hypothetical protein [Mycolicibacterium fluoranthenivorans]NIH98069.1 hypothetical protein [Mycolicibacterium fluoranthenivorans]